MGRLLRPLTLTRTGRPAFGGQVTDPPLRGCPHGRTRTCTERLRKPLPCPVGRRGGKWVTCGCRERQRAAGCDAQRAALIESAQMRYMRTSGSPETRNNRREHAETSVGHGPSRRASALYITRISWIGGGSCRDSQQCGTPSAPSRQLPPGWAVERGIRRAGGRCPDGEHPQCIGAWKL